MRFQLAAVAAATALFALPMSAFAEGGHGHPAPAPVLIAEPALIADWSGGYVGLSAGQWTGEFTFTAVPRNFDDTTAVGIHGGYLFQSGSFVYGAEIAYTPVEQEMAIPGVTFDDQLVDMLDISARAGFVTGDFQIYGLLGLSRSTLELFAVSGFTSTDMTGVHAGIGADYRLSEQFSFGAAFVHRQFEDIDYNPGFNSPIAEITSQSLSLRANFHF